MHMGKQFFVRLIGLAGILNIFFSAQAIVVRTNDGHVVTLDDCWQRRCVFPPAFVEPVDMPISSADVEILDELFRINVIEVLRNRLQSMVEAKVSPERLLLGMAWLGVDFRDVLVGEVATHVAINACQRCSDAASLIEVLLNFEPTYGALAFPVMAEIARRNQQCGSALILANLPAHHVVMHALAYGVAWQTYDIFDGTFGHDVEVIPSIFRRLRNAYGDRCVCPIVYFYLCMSRSERFMIDPALTPVIPVGEFFDCLVETRLIGAFFPHEDLACMANMLRQAQVSGSDDFLDFATRWLVRNICYPAFLNHFGFNRGGWVCLHSGESSNLLANAVDTRQFTRARYLIEQCNADVCLHAGGYPLIAIASIHRDADMVRLLAIHTKSKYVQRSKSNYVRRFVSQRVKQGHKEYEAALRLLKPGVQESFSDARLSEQDSCAAGSAVGPATTPSASAPDLQHECADENADLVSGVSAACLYPGGASRRVAEGTAVQVHLQPRLAGPSPDMIEPTGWCGCRVAPRIKKSEKDKHNP